MSPNGKYLAAVSFDNKSLYVRENVGETWRKCFTAQFIEEPAWPADSSWVQFIAKIPDIERGLFRVSPNCESPRQIEDLSAYQFLGATWIGIAPDHSPMGLLRLPDEIYAIDWQLRRRLP